MTKLSIAGFAFCWSYREMVLRSCSGNNYFRCLLTALVI
jgi:hypothetical protein